MRRNNAAFHVERRIRGRSPEKRGQLEQRRASLTLERRNGGLHLSCQRLTPRDVEIRVRSRVVAVYGDIPLTAHDVE